MASRIETQVIRLILERAETGKKKYGTTMERSDFSPKRWIRELQAELLDGAIYAERVAELFEAMGETVDIDTLIEICKIITQVGKIDVLNELRKIEGKSKGGS